MKRIQEKVKDLIDVQSYKILPDFYQEPAETLATYHFTDATSDLMSKWFDRVVSLQTGEGAANALAGYRGVGKSHFLATFGAIIGNPELRSRISDAHVSAGVQGLKRRHYPVASVKRGSHATLLEEIKSAIEKTFEIEINEPNIYLKDLFALAVEKSEDLTFIFLVDTAGDRSSRVDRDDGETLGQIAELSKELNMFVAVALDDDIAGADGANQAITDSFAIDFLDQEHLYKIVDSHIFPKHRQALPLLNEIYANFRQVLPDFRWSEQRFTSLYPLHPAILELAPFVRLYVQNFALLGFASEAGDKILGRPANSLITLDEIFDSVELNLRKVEDLKSAFEIFDLINSKIIGELPVMKRLQAKLILKSLLLLSLDGEGTTAGEICSAMLIFDENGSAEAEKNVRELLEIFSQSSDGRIEQNEIESGKVKYKLKISVKDDLNVALAKAIQTVSKGVIPKILRRSAREKFADWTLAEDEKTENLYCTDSVVNWRGGLRRGKVFWDLTGQNDADSNDNFINDLIDWEIIITQKPENFKNLKESDAIPKIFWKPAQMRIAEAETILRFHVLLSDEILREQFGEQIRQAGHSHKLSVDKIWNRLFIEDASIIYQEKEKSFSEIAKEASNLAELLEEVLNPVFPGRYPNHPTFAQTLEMTDVSALVNDFFSGARTNLENIQQLAEIYAQPLGLVVRRENTFLLESEENLINLPIVHEVLNLVRAKGEEVVLLSEIYNKLKAKPYGLVREAQHLVLTALVAQRQIEFVTSKGDRINRRSLDLKIIWDDIAGIAKPKTILYSSKELTNWVRILTGSSSFQNIETPTDLENIRAALKVWFDDWNSSNILKKFDELPAEILNTKIWRFAANAEKTFGSAAQTVHSILEDSINLEEGLHRIVDAFSDSETEYLDRIKDLLVLNDFIGAIEKRAEITNYLAVCDLTDVQNIESLRERLFEIIDEIYHDPNQTLYEELENVWEEFFRQFGNHFAHKHDLIMKSHHLQEKYDEILRSKEWFEFEMLSNIPVFPQTHRKQARAVIQKFRELDCRFDVREMLKKHPFCVCSFKLSRLDEWEKLPETLQNLIKDGREVYLKILHKLKDALIPLIEQFAGKIADEEFNSAAKHLAEILQKGETNFLTDNELIILQKVLENNLDSQINMDNKNIALLS